MYKNKLEDQEDDLLEANDELRWDNETLEEIKDDILKKKEEIEQEKLAIVNDQQDYNQEFERY